MSVLTLVRAERDGGGMPSPVSCARSRLSRLLGALILLLLSGCPRITTGVQGLDEDAGVVDAFERLDISEDGDAGVDASRDDAQATGWDAGDGDAPTDRAIAVDALNTPDTGDRRPDGSTASAYATCDTPDYPDVGWDRGTCACLGASDGIPGICRNPFALGACRRGLCLDGAASNIEGLSCLSLDQDRRLDAECESRAFCLALRDLHARPPRTAHRAECRYSDGTSFETGEVRAANCPIASVGILCGRGCAPCGMGAGVCWGFSEQNPLGACMQVSNDLPTCQTASDCPKGTGCLRPRNLDSLNRPAQGLCQPGQRCERVSTIAPGRFVCDQ